MITNYKLPLSYNTEKLRSDLSKILPDDWKPHYSKSDYEFGWSTAILRSVEGSADNQQATKGDFKNTPLLEKCPYFQEVLDSFKSTAHRVRLLKLDKGAVIREHIDEELNFDFGEVRIHIPVVTDPKVEFFVDGNRVIMKEGEAWYIDTTFRHKVANLSEIDRVHLVIDFTVNEWFKSLFPPGIGGPAWRRRIEYEMRCMQFKLSDAAVLLKKDPKELKNKIVRKFRRNLT